MSFDNYGIWKFKKTAFSKHGNLKKTIVHLVRSAFAGLTGKQLGEILGLSPQSFLHHFRNCPGIIREKHAGVYVYFSDDVSIWKRQEEKRQTIVSQPEIRTISNSEAILILVAIIKNHGISAKDILKLPEIKLSKIKLATIQYFLEYHGLEKKTLDSGP